MPDARPVHTKVSLLNQPTPPFNGPGAALYGPRGPQRAHNTGRQRRPLSGQPMSIEHHIDDAIAKVPDLSPKQRNALRNTMMAMTRDVSFLKMALDAAKAKGPWSEAAVQDEGRPPL